MFSLDGRTLVTISNGITTPLWNLTTGQQTRHPAGRISQGGATQTRNGAALLVPLVRNWAPQGESRLSERRMTGDQLRACVQQAYPAGWSLQLPVSPSPSTEEGISRPQNARIPMSRKYRMHFCTIPNGSERPGTQEPHWDNPMSFEHAAQRQGRSEIPGRLSSCGLLFALRDRACRPDCA